MKALLRKIILVFAIALIFLLAIPACVFIPPIILIWTLTDAVLKRMDN